MFHVKQRFILHSAFFIPYGSMFHVKHEWRLYAEGFSEEKRLALRARRDISGAVRMAQHPFAHFPGQRH